MTIRLDGKFIVNLHFIHLYFLIDPLSKFNKEEELKHALILLVVKPFFKYSYYCEFIFCFFRLVVCNYLNL